MARIVISDKKIIYQPSTQEIFRCLSYMPQYSQILLEHGPGKIYQPFLQWLLEVNYLNEIEERLTIKKIAARGKYEVAKITKWLHEIYNDIFELNEEHPDLFFSTGINIELYMRSYDDACIFNVTVLVIPRKFEAFEFPFVNAKIGTSDFWVKDVRYSLDNDKMNVSIWLYGSIMNRYREFALDKALFHGRIHSMDVFQKRDFEIDEELKRLDK